MKKARGISLGLFWSELDFQTHRAVVGTQHILIDGGGGDLLRQAVGYQKIVDAPACIVGSGVKAIAPPGVGSGGIGIPETEGVCEAAVQELREALPLFVGESGVAAVGSRVF